MSDTQPGAPGVAAATTVPKPVSNTYRLYVMVMLFLVYAFNFLDRQIISILAIPIREELGLDDRQLGLLGGIAFALLYSTLGVPIAWLADRTNRVWIITVSLTVWSGFTALCGMAQNFWQLFAARVGVGVGEAGGVAPSYSLIADYFPPEARARALAFYSLGIPLGSAFGVIAGAQIASGNVGEGLDWRWAFIIVGFAGVLLAPIFRLTVREPARGQLDSVKLDRSAVTPDMSGRGGPLTSLGLAFARAGDWKGRSRRSEFWWIFILRTPLIIAAILFLAPALATATDGTFALVLGLLLAILLVNIVMLAAATRRLHDIGKTGRWLLLAVVPAAVTIWAQASAQDMWTIAAVLTVIGELVLVTWFVRDSDGDNRFGPAPKKPDAELGLSKRSKPNFADTLAVLVGKPAFWFLTFGAACSSMMGYGVFFWVPSFFARSYGLDLVTTGWLFGGLLIIGGSAGIILGGFISDWVGKKSKAYYALVPAVAFLFTMPFYLVGVLAPNATVAFFVFIIPNALALAWLGPVLSAFQNLVTASMRTVASSIFLLINNLLGIGVGIYVLGELSTLLTPALGDESLRYSILIGSCLYLVAAGLMYLASRTLARDWEG